MYERKLYPVRRAPNGRAEDVARAMERAQPSAQPLLPHDTERKLAETAGVGASILNALHAQRRELEGAQTRIAGAESGLAAAGSTMQAIMKRVLVRRAVYCAVVLALLGAIAWTLWWKLQVHSGK